MITRKLIGAVGALVLTAFAALVLASPAQAAEVASTTVTVTATITDSPDDGCPEPWARDTFKRTITITTGEVAGTYKVTISDAGTFATQVGAPSPGDSGVPIAAKVTGELTGSGEFAVTGTLLDAAALGALDKTLDNSAYACKSDVPAERTTGKWPLRYFATDATTTGIDPWKWTYDTDCETRTESSKSGETAGNITGEVCPTPSASPTTPAPAPSTTRPASTTQVAEPPGEMPITGPSGPMLVGGGVILLATGAGLLVLAGRRRRARFES